MRESQVWFLLQATERVCLFFQRYLSTSKRLALKQKGQLIELDCCLSCGRPGFNSCLKPLKFTQGFVPIYVCLRYLHTSALNWQEGWISHWVKPLAVTWETLVWFLLQALPCVFRAHLGFKFCGPWKQNKTKQWLFSRFSDMSRFCSLSHFFVLNHHRTVVPACFGLIWDF